MEKYEPILKEYEHWKLILSAKQHPYIGRCKVWAKREDADEITTMTPEERVELFDVIVLDWDKAVKKLYDPYRINFSVLGNTIHHLHVHLIPRYNELKVIHGEKFIDPNPTGNYSPYPKKKMSLQFMKRIELDFKSVL